MKKNPPNSIGQTSACAICESICHWAAECPHDHEKQVKDAAKQAEFELFSNAVQECYVEKLVKHYVVHCWTVDVPRLSLEVSGCNVIKKS